MLDRVAPKCFVPHSKKILTILVIKIVNNISWWFYNIIIEVLTTNKKGQAL